MMQNLSDGADYNFCIHGKGHIVHISEIVPEPVLPVQSISSVDLCKSGESRPHVMPAHLLLRVVRKISDKEGARTHKGHIPLQDIDEFRKLIQTGRTKNLSEMRKSFRIRKEISLFVPRIGHGTKLHKSEYFPVLSRPFLMEEHRRAKLFPDQQH